MADYFFVYDRAVFEQLRPPLAAAWRERSFAPCRPLCRSWAPAARDYAAKYHVRADDILLFQVDHDLPFDRAFWRTLAGELLLFAAREIPEFPTTFDTLTHLLAPHASSAFTSREKLPPIHQALRGSRDLRFGAALYRPEHAGHNNADDVLRLAKYLASVRPDEWTTADLPATADLEAEEDRIEELAFAREWFGVVADLYRRAADAGQVLVLESIG